MRRWESLLAILAVVLASVAASPVRSRLLFALAAMLLLAVVGVSRLRAAMSSPPVESDAAARAQRIRESRGPRRP